MIRSSLQMLVAAAVLGGARSREGGEGGQAVRFASTRARYALRIARVNAQRRRRLGATLETTDEDAKSACSVRFDCSLPALAAHAASGASAHSLKAAWCCRWHNQDACDAVGLHHAAVLETTNPYGYTGRDNDEHYTQFVHGMNLLELAIERWDAAIGSFEGAAEVWSARVGAADGVTVGDGGDDTSDDGTSTQQRESLLWEREATIYGWERTVLTYEHIGLQWEGDSTSTAWIRRTKGVERLEAKVWCQTAEILTWRTELLSWR